MKSTAPLSRWAATLAAILVCVAGLSACGSSSDNDNAAAAAVSQSLLAVQSGDIKLTSEQAACIATSVVKSFGITKSVSYGLLTKDLKPVTSIKWALSPTDASTYADAMMRCADLSTSIIPTHSPRARGVHLFQESFPVRNRHRLP